MHFQSVGCVSWGFFQIAVDIDAPDGEQRACVGDPLNDHAEVPGWREQAKVNRRSFISLNWIDAQSVSRGFMSDLGAGIEAIPGLVCPGGAGRFVPEAMGQPGRETARHTAPEHTKIMPTVEGTIK